MEALYDTTAPKKATNLSINSDLLRRSRELDINLSATLEQALKKALARQQEVHWKKENRAAIISYNEFVEENGCFADEHRSF
jgi:antitoxin CcdA